MSGWHHTLRLKVLQLLVDMTKMTWCEMDFGASSHAITHAAISRLRVGRIFLGMLGRHFVKIDVVSLMMVVKSELG